MSITDPRALFTLLLAGDINPFLRIALPAALASARGGDPTVLLRLKRLAREKPVPARVLSMALFYATTCQDAARPYTLAMPLNERRTRATEALGRVDPARYLPFDEPTIFAQGPAEDCLLWPADPERPPYNGPLPDIPVLVLGGELDMRTPFENARATARQFPHASLLEAPATGHIVLDSALHGCVARALRRFVRDTEVGHPCAGARRALSPVPLPPRSWRDFRAPAGLERRRGKVLLAVLDTVTEARLSAFQALFAGRRSARGGGLRGGRFAFRGGRRDRLILHDYCYAPGVRLTGTVLDDGKHLQRAPHRPRTPRRERLARVSSRPRDGPARQRDRALPRRTRSRPAIGGGRRLADS